MVMHVVRFKEGLYLPPVQCNTRLKPLFLKLQRVTNCHLGSEELLIFITPVIITVVEGVIRTRIILVGPQRAVLC
uniref:Uncharacterized protein n=1 Tax=Anguilla anguilla TaxID=7936 RepID=A0A0E9RQF9_ANGAN